ncbi:MAG TPA: hypothetical protein VK541_17210 [Pedobacter sp.]|uniref:hypothetical protein n=1 Tax=Pedobacter sp. TaxID=1411316 RepID=UPI002BF7C35F|nr:hypothetical protein [Pedobacter sp.]HMI04231.1 hypothetical protein [Pedobacter sp.]
MRQIIFMMVCFLILTISCKKSKEEGKEVVNGDLKETVETVNGSTYKIFRNKDADSFKGILVIGSGNNENNPSEGTLDGGAETALCRKAAENGYAAAIVKYRKTPGNANADSWNTSAKMIGEDFDKCIVAISDKYGIDKTKSVVGGFSFASYMLFSDISANATLSYCKGVLAACGGSGAWNAQNFKIPIYAINCSGNNEGEYYGKSLYDQIPNNSPVKAKSEGVTDNSCNTHCGGNWTDKMYAKMVTWLN